MSILFIIVYYYLEPLVNIIITAYYYLERLLDVYLNVLTSVLYF